MITYTQKQYDHELNRVQSMTDEQLVSRYGKMKNEGKIRAFVAVLSTEKRHPVLHNAISSKHNWRTIYALIKYKTGELYYFTVCKSGIVLDLFDSSTGEYTWDFMQMSIEEGREFWNTCVEDGGWNVHDADKWLESIPS